VRIIDNYKKTGAITVIAPVLALINTAPQKSGGG
jgi:hypothetical protein